MFKRVDFTPFEVAQLLGKKQEQDLKKMFSVTKKGKTVSEFLSVVEFEQEFNISYSPFLRFSSLGSFKKTIHSCPYLLRLPWLVSENYEMAKTYNEELKNGEIGAVSIKWVNEEMGYGLFANSDMKPQTYLGEYTGHVRRLSRFHSDPNEYCLHYPTKYWSLCYTVIDASKIGNELRFMNHSDNPNVAPFCVVDRQLLHLIFLTTQAVSKGAELRFNYGRDFWQRRQKSQV